MPDDLNEIEDEIPRLRRYARYLCRDADRADELVQDCLVKAIDKIGSFEPGTHRRAWLFTILRNQFLNDMRRSRRHQADSTLDASDEALAVAAPQPSALMMADIRDAFLALSDGHREVLTLVAIEGMAYEEAASVLDVPVGTVRSRLSRARETLRRVLEPDTPPSAPSRGAGMERIHD